MSSSSKARSRFSKVVNKLQAIALIMLVLFGVAPVLLSAIPGTSSNVSFSIYNTGYDGLSNVRKNLEAVKTNSGLPKYNVSNIVSNLNILNRFNGSGTLVIVGPSSDFGVTETISIILYMLRGGSVIIADDFGTGNQILKPIFDAFQNLDKFAAQARAQGFNVPSISDIFGSGSSSNSSSGSSGGITSQIPGNTGSFGGASSSIDQGDFITNLIGNLIVQFGFNTSGILMDVKSNSGNPARPVIQDFYPSDIPGYTFTQNINKVAMEFGSIISVQLKIDARDQFGNVILDSNGDPVKKKVWQPLQKITGSLISDQYNDSSFSLPLPFFPMYSSKYSWIETNFKSAANGNMEPNQGEWGNANFATALSIPMFPGFGKLVFLSDPSIFINRYTEQDNIYDNMRLILNLMDMATYDQQITVSNPQIPILFDFGHVYQGLTSPSLYSTALLKLIAEMSMFPLFAPFVPFFAYGYGKRLMPKNRRLRPILLTKRRGERGHSDFERKLELIKETGTYGEPIMYMAKRLVRKIRNDIRFEGVTPKSPKESAKFFKDNFPLNIGSERELRSQLATIFRIAEHPTRRMSKLAAKKYLDILKKLDGLLST